ncbi:MAG TPA: DUF2071 domain-containing protein [Acidimicrobiales bacterium]|jgi:hypothetical protein|nr:DUF2071 domain-containing protein [Acidimicrobiales bacterium]
MSAGAVRAIIERRILVNYRVDAEALRGILPAPFRPVLVDGSGIAGICLIRLGRIRPAGVPTALGMTTENAAHRVAVEWDTADGPVTGVFIPRRDTSSRLVSLVGGRAFPGWHHRAAFNVSEGGGRYRVGMRSLDGTASVAVAASAVDRPMAGSVFASVDEASAFFRRAPVGYAPTPRSGEFDGVALSTCGWGMHALRVESVASSWFDDTQCFPAGSAVLDSAFLMEHLDTRWTPLPALVAATTGAETVTPVLL